MDGRSAGARSKETPGQSAGRMGEEKSYALTVGVPASAVQILSLSRVVPSRTSTSLSEARSSYTSVMITTAQ